MTCKLLKIKKEDIYSIDTVPSDTLFKSGTYLTQTDNLLRYFINLCTQRFLIKQALETPWEEQYVCDLCIHQEFMETLWKHSDQR